MKSIMKTNCQYQIVNNFILSLKKICKNSALIATVTILIGIYSTFLVTKYKDYTNTKNELLSLTNLLHNAVKGKNIDELNLVLADDVVIELRDHSKISKTDFVSFVMGDKAIIKELTVHNFDFNQNGEQFIITCKLDITFLVDEKYVQQQADYLYVYQKRDKNWKLIYSGSK